eukprot:TRINITY_DN2281_c0_g2_i1.p1 TRINITY_DN2281_c0_g2~~TRINITY_DN2281_c0_g2_i1.p1  ORF type:complete len:275 (+),score=70.03 TRINITY_DN2281_c0_g2_i1:57-881(+)
MVSAPPAHTRRVTFAEPGLEEVTVPAAVVAYHCHPEEDKLVGYLAKVKRPGETVWAVRRFKEWHCFHEELAKTLKVNVAFPEKSRLMGWFNQTNERRRLIEDRRVQLNGYVTTLCAMRNVDVDAALVRFLAPEHASSSAKAMSLAPSSQHHVLTFPWEKKHSTDRLYLRLPWGFASPQGQAYFRGDTHADAKLRHGVYRELHAWFSAYQEGDRLPSLRELVKCTRALVDAAPRRARKAAPRALSSDSLGDSLSSEGASEPEPEWAAAAVPRHGG